MYVYKYIMLYGNTYIYTCIHMTILCMNIRLLHLRVKKLIVWYRKIIEKRKVHRLLIMFTRSRGIKIIQRQFRIHIDYKKNAAVAIQRIIRGRLKRKFIENSKMKVYIHMYLYIYIYIYIYKYIFHCKLYLSYIYTLIIYIFIYTPCI
jgi:hypothetical protein